MNEPQCFIMNGYMTGAHAPFKHRYLALPKLTKNCMIAFAKSVKTIRQYAKTPPKIGVAFASGAYVPQNETHEALETARKKSFETGLGLMSNRWWCDPILLGNPVSAYGVFRIGKKTAEKVKCDLDFIGVNVYQPFAEGSWGNKPNTDLPEEKLTSLGWVIDERVLYYTVKFFYERYKLPVMVTENGMADHDVLTPDGVHDEKRRRFIVAFLGQLKKAVDEGVPVLGYQYWSLTDNFEWAEGYGPRFGLIHVDYQTQRRTVKDSGLCYADIIRTNGEYLC